MNMKVIIYISLLLFSLSSYAIGSGNVPVPKKKVTVIIDAGHGGHDPGNLNSTAGLKKEKDINLMIAKKLGEYLKEYLPNQVEIIYTRTKDVFIPLEDRVSVANSKKADYFLSIHCNANSKKQIAGTETHVNTRESKVSLALAREIQNQFSNRAGRQSRGVKFKPDRGFDLVVLKGSSMPAVLVECGFMTNKTEEAYLNSDRGQSLIASAIFRAFRDYIKKRHGIIQQDHPEASPVKKGPQYKIQVLASNTPYALDIPDFKKVGLPIEEIKMEGNTFKYKYYAGSYESKKEAKKALKQVQESPFKDAFIVRFD